MGIAGAFSSARRGRAPRDLTRRGYRGIWPRRVVNFSLAGVGHFSRAPKASADEAGDFVFAEFFAEIRELLPAVVDEAGSRFLAGGEAKDMHLLRRDGKWFKCH